MKQNISHEEIIEKAKIWLTSISNEELCKMIEEEDYLTELDSVINFEWLNKIDLNIINDLPNVESVALTSKDEGKFVWSLSKMFINNNLAKFSHTEDLEIFDNVEAA